MKAPLIIGADIRNISKESLAILMNKEIIAINQDPNSLQALCFTKEGCSGPVKSYITTLTGGAKAIVVTNWGDKTHDHFSFTLADAGLKLENKGDAAVFEDLYDPTNKQVINV
jgi:alpha-galactosidase